MTTGNDCNITLWDIPKEQTKQKVQPAPTKKQKGKGKKGKRNHNARPSPKAAEPQVQQEPEQQEKPHKITTIHHSSKVNWMTTMHPKYWQSDSRASFFIADQSNEISFYSVQ